MSKVCSACGQPGHNKTTCSTLRKTAPVVEYAPETDSPYIVQSYNTETHVWTTERAANYSQAIGMVRAYHKAQVPATLHATKR